MYDRSVIMIVDEKVINKRENVIVGVDVICHMSFLRVVKWVWEI